MNPEDRQLLRRKLVFALEAVRSLFRPGCKVTLFIHWPGADPAHNLLLTDDNWEQLPDALKRTIDTNLRQANTAPNPVGTIQ